ncbi:MAG: efflux RND transporter periplasmic adaptor subunit [Saprospiraceae bacterium]|nr:efflux RND transporter periplasmic adaptor subunit [Saprospiraceae bacterium]
MKKVKQLKWYTWTLILLIPTLIVAAIFKAKGKPRGEEVTMEQVQRRDIVETVTASGKIFPETEIKISSDVSGEIVELFVREGDSVRTGQVLARVNADAYESAVERSSAGVKVARTQAVASKNSIESSKQMVEQARLQLDLARRTHLRNEELFRGGILAKSEYEASETNLRNLELSLRNAETALKNAIRTAEAAGYQVSDAEAVLKEQRSNLGRTVIKAPVDGIISRLNVEKGERVVGTIQMSGTELMRIADLNAMEVQVEVSESDIVRVETGDEAEIEVDAYANRKFSGRVSEVSNSASNLGSFGSTALSTDQVSKYIVKVRIDKASYSALMQGGKVPFRPGMSATSEIKTSRVEGVISIPIQAVVAYDPNERKSAKGDKPGEDNAVQTVDSDAERLSTFREAVFVVIGDTVARKDVVTGIQDTEFIEILEGLEGGEMVVTGPYAALSRRLKPGSRVHKKKEEKEKED